MAIFGTDDRILVADQDVTMPPYNSVNDKNYLLMNNNYQFKIMIIYMFKT